jgi:hypothetical protein
MVAGIGLGIVRNANEIGLQELTQSHIVRVTKFLTPATPADSLSTNSEAGNRKRSAGARASLVGDYRRGPVGI